MWIDESDTTQLAQRLRVGPRELLEYIGGPWQVVDRTDERAIERPGTLFVGRAGPSVAILLSDAADPTILVGVAVGEWQGVWPLLWTIGEPTVALTTPPRDAESEETDDLLDRLGRAVDAAAAAKRPSLVICRYCGALVAPEHALGDDTCHACGTSVLGVVF